MNPNQMQNIPPQLLQALAGGATGVMPQLMGGAAGGLARGVGQALSQPMPQVAAQPMMGQGQQGMNPAHNNFYEQLRQFLMQNMHIPGVDKILNAVNQQHISQLTPKNQMAPTMPGIRQQ